MTHEELLNLAAESDPATMEKVAAMVYLTERLDPVFAAESTGDFAEILDRAATGLEKSASVSPAGAIGISVAGSILGALGTAVSADLYDAAKRGLSSSRNFNNILRHNPELENSFKKEDLRKSFNVVHRYGPEFTADPTLGGQLLFAASRSPESLPMLMKDLTSNRKNIIEAKNKQFAPHFNVADAYLSAAQHAESRADRAADKADRAAERAADKAEHAAEKAEKAKNFESSKEYAEILNKIRPTLRHRAPQVVSYQPSSQTYHRKP